MVWQRNGVVMAPLRPETRQRRGGMKRHAADDAAAAERDVVARVGEVTADEATAEQQLPG